ncbi:MAG: hypothetical protein MRY79_04785 [Alphaproteobacteria bacterium]|nr:hypothetical protein [Alphaproteobacteria bacterium]
MRSLNTVFCKISAILTVIVMSNFWHLSAALAGNGVAQRAANAAGAHGQGAAGGGGGSTLGSVITNLMNSTEGFPSLFAGFCYLCGLVFGFLGIWKLRMHVENPNQTEIWDPLKRFLAGGAFFSLPYLRDVVIETMAKGTDDISGSDFNTGGASSTGLDAMLVALMRDVWDPLQMIFVVFGYIAGLILIIIGVSRLLKSEQEGARGPMGFGTIMTFIVAGALLSLNKMLGAASESLFQSGAMNHAALSYTKGMEGSVGHANAVIGAIMAFVAILGWISFIRGFFIMRGVAEGNQQASAMAGLTHIIGGAIAVNLGAFINAVQSTLGITDYGLTISSVEPYLTSVTFIV